MTLIKMMTIYDALKDSRNHYEDEAAKALSLGLDSLVSYYERKFDTVADTMEEVRGEMIAKFHCDPEAND